MEITLICMFRYFILLFLLSYSNRRRFRVFQNATHQPTTDGAVKWVGGGLNRTAFRIRNGSPLFWCDHKDLMVQGGVWIVDLLFFENC